MLPFSFRRKQFPVRLSFAMTINKSQGQTFHKVGVHLEKPVFTHGQLYVAFSRVRAINNLKVKLNNGERVTKNIAFREILFQ
jgi:ATP-dependent exoDNAse (exonuclease V) alpha subunit